MKWSEANALAEELRELLAAHCAEVAIVGSLRRKAAFVDDLDLLIVPFPNSSGLFAEHPSVHHRIDYLVELKTFALRFDHLGRSCYGERLRRVSYKTAPVEINIVMPPAHRGVIELIRTGPSDFSAACVTVKSKGGLLPEGWQVRDGMITSISKPHVRDIPTERDYFAFLGLPYIEPEERKHWKSKTRRSE